MSLLSAQVSLPSPPLVRLVLPKAQNLWHSLVWDALRFLGAQWPSGFSESRHTMPFPREQGFQGEQDHQSGDVFQRALIADALCDINEILNGQLQPMIDYEANYLLSCRRAAGVGGWSYFPDLRELPPDADDLAQIIQVLLRSNRRTDVIAHCETPLRVLLSDCTHPDGSFETWILPSSKRTAEQELQADWVNKAWGTGPDNDVMANLLYALALYDRARFKDIIFRGTEYLKRAQQSDGTWSASWYHGPYYPLYVSIRLLALISPSCPGVRSALDYLAVSQHGDGGWGPDNESDPLNTALALLALAEGNGRSGDPIQARTEQAFEFLRKTQERDLGWPSCRFISMGLGRASGRVQLTLFYGSRTITSTFVAKAAVAWHRLMQSAENPSSNKRDAE